MFTDETDHSTMIADEYLLNRTKTGDTSEKR